MREVIAKIVYRLRNATYAKFFLLLRAQPRVGDAIVIHKGLRVVICDFCGGNCGQCGGTGRYGHTPSGIFVGHPTPNLDVMARRTRGDQSTFKEQEMYPRPRRR